jgi:hypothetical protein
VITEQIFSGHFLVRNFNNGAWPLGRGPVLCIVRKYSTYVGRKNLFLQVKRCEGFVCAHKARRTKIVLL